MPYSDSDLITPCNASCSFCFLNHVDALEKSYLFQGLSHKVIGDLIREVPHQVKTFEKGQVIASSGDNYHKLYIIVQGSVVGEITDFEGNILRIEELGVPEIIASLFIFGDDNTLPVDIISTSATRLLAIRKEDLVTLFMQQERILRNYLNIMANKAQLLSKKIKLLGLNSIRGKVAHYLLEQVNRQHTTKLRIKNTQQELASMFGVSRPSLARVMRQMHGEGLIEAKGKEINILNKRALSDCLK